MIGEAMKSEEYVPTMTPMINANMNPLMESPPKMNIASNTIKVVSDVFTVLPKVLLNAVFTVLENTQPGCFV